MMPTIEHCTTEQFGTGYKVIAEEGYAIYRKDRYNAWLEYCEEHELHPKKVPEIALFDFISFTKAVYLPANNNGSNYGIMEIAEGMRVYG